MTMFGSPWFADPDTLSITPDTFNPDDKNSNITLSNGNLTATWGGGANVGVRAFHAIADGQSLYCELTCSTVNGEFGVNPTVVTANLATDAEWHSRAEVCGYRKDGTFSYFISGTTAEASYTSGRIIGFAVTRSGSTVKVYVHSNGTYLVAGDASSTPNPATAANPNGTYTIGYAIHMGGVQRDGTSVITANFGASAFSYDVPDGFTAGWGAAL